MRKTPFEAEELQRAVEHGNDVPGLSNAELREAAQKVFFNGEPHTLDVTDYQERIIHRNYEDYDLCAHRLPNLVQDVLLLIQFMRQAVESVGQTTQDSSGAILNMGCGPGRLAIPFIEIAQKLGIKEVIFNDLLDYHVDQTRETIRSVYNTDSQTIKGVDLTFRTGDFIDVAESLVKEERKKIDAVFSMFFVTSEIADFSSAEALRERRELLYKRVVSVLTKQGVFVEDVPDTDLVGYFYYLARRKSYAILEDMGLLDGENNNMILSRFKDGAFPWHLRYAPSGQTHQKELENAGLTHNFHEVSPIDSVIHANRLEEFKYNIGSPRGMQAILDQGDVYDIEDRMKAKRRDFIVPNRNPNETQQRRISLNRRQYS